MNKELFGVFGDAETFESFRSPMEFDRVVEGPNVTFGIRDVGLGIPGRTDIAADDDGVAAVWGEVFLDGKSASPVQWLREAVPERGPAALDPLNGSYLAVVDAGGESFVATDPTRTWECYYTDDPGVRVFGTDPAAVARTIDDPTFARRPMLEFLHLTVILNDRTLFEELHRIPFDSLLTADSTVELDRFVYEPKEFDYVTELSERLGRALRRRSTHPGRKGVLLSAGYDSRLLVSGVPGIDVAYTIGKPHMDEPSVARKIANQYGVQHRALEPDVRYINTAADDVQYGLGIKESIHVHQAGYEPQMNVDTVYHGLLFDTYLRGHFLPRDSTEVMGVTIPHTRLKSDPDPADSMLSKFGYMAESEEAFAGCDGLPDDAYEFARRAIEDQFPADSSRFDSIYDRLAMFGIQNQPSTPFRYHLADNFLESFVAADAELLDWHLSTPPEYRNTRTFKRAIRKLDSDLLRHPPPDRPHDFHKLNQMERFVRRNVPGLHAFEPSWPDRQRIYDEANLDSALFPTSPEVHEFPPRLKLRLNDLSTWMKHVTNQSDLVAGDFLCPRGQARLLSTSSSP